MLLAEDAEDMVNKIKAALSFAQNLEGRDKLARDAVLAEVEKIEDDMIPLDDLIEILRKSVWDL